MPQSSTKCICSSTYLYTLKAPQNKKIDIKHILKATDSRTALIDIPI